jgi:ribulose-bisphosphate carboxylase large chain
LQHLVFRDFSWSGREPLAYKADGALPFEGVSRHELLGKTGERAAFDLRYFELSQGGYTSHEKHGHTHAVVCLRGRGELTCQGQSLALQPMDIAYVPPFEAHQLKNAGAEPFGFLCIVDRHRDRPTAP